MYEVLDISTSALVAQRTNLDVIAGNIAMRETWNVESGNLVPFRRKVALLASGDRAGGKSAGTHVAKIMEDPSPFEMRWEPTSPFAYKDGAYKGYVPASNVDYHTEMVNAMTAVRAYEANVTVMEMAKSMAATALRVIA